MRAATVVTLSYNSPDIYAAIDSVLMQSYEDIQYIIVDDGSKEFNRDAVIEYISGNNRGNVTAEVIANQQNVGTIKAFNIALEYAKGDYIISLAGDDVFYDDNVVRDIVNEFKNSGAKVITGYRCICDEAMNMTKVILPTKREVSLIKKLKPSELFEAMTGYNSIFGCCTAYSRQCLNEFGRFDERYRYIEDYTMIMKLLRSGIRIRFFDRVIVKYRSGGVSSLANVKDRYRQEHDDIFNNEVVPYSVNPKSARKKYNDWKRRLEIDKEYAQKVEQCHGNKWKRLLLKCSYYISHPRILYSVIREKLY